MGLKDFLGVMRRRKWTIIRAALIVAAVTLLVGWLLGPTYEGVAVVLVSEQDPVAATLGTNLPDLSSQPERSLQTHIELIQLRPRLEQVITELRLDTTPEELARHVLVSPKGQTNLLTIAAQDRDPGRAASIANALANVYVAWSRDQKHLGIESATREVQARLDEAQKVLDEMRLVPQGKDQSGVSQAELTIAANRYAGLVSRLDELRISDQLQGATGSLVSTATAETQLVSPKPVRDTGIGLGLGLLVGLGIAFATENLKDVMTTGDEAADAYGVPALGQIPGRQTEDSPTLAKPGSAEAEGYAELRNSLDFISRKQHIKSVLVTSAGTGEGKSTVAANLAAALARAGNEVVFLDCDFRRPIGQQFFAVNTSVGLSNVLSGEYEVAQALQRPAGFDSLLVLPAGRTPANPGELLGSPAMEAMVASIASVADWIIVDTPPLLVLGDAAAAARWSDGVLVVTQVGLSTLEAAKRSRQMLENVGARILGVVAVGLDISWGKLPYGAVDDPASSDGD